MSYQGWACSAWILDWDFIKSIAPKEAEDFEKACNGQIDEIAFALSVEEEIREEENEALNKLTEAFAKETDLTIDIGYISYDEVDSDEHGAVWFVGGVQELTPAGKKYAKHLNYLRWVEYG